MKISRLLAIGVVLYLGAGTLSAQNLGSAKDGFDPNANVSVRALAVQAEGRSL